MVLFRLSILLVIVLAGVDGQQVEFPEDTAATVGDNAKMHCAYNETGCFKIKWQKSLESGMVEDISDGSRVFNEKKYRLDISSACDLVIEDVQPSDFGVFTCNISGSASGSAVLFEPPELAAVKDGDTGVQEKDGGSSGTTPAPGVSVGLIVGVSIGAVVAIIVVILAVCGCRKCLNGCRVCCN